MKGPHPLPSLLAAMAHAVIAAALLALFVRTFVVQPFVVPSSSMEQGLQAGDHILVNKWVYAQPPEGLWARGLPHRRPARSEVVVFKFPENPRRDFLKRCLGLPGEQVELVDKTLFIDGVALDETSYVFDNDTTIYPRSLYLHEGHRNRDNYGPVNVPSGYYFCLGDHRNESRDSRFWGPVPESYFKGRAWIIYWSVAPLARAGDEDREGGDDPAAEAAGLFERTRWERLLRRVR